MSLLKASALRVFRGGRAILDNVSLEAQQGEFIVLIGANGAGKSTLLAVLAGLLKLDHGTVLIDGHALSAFGGAQLARKRAYLPQNPICEWPISVERLVTLGLTPSLPALSALPDAFREKVGETLAALDLIAHRDQAATTLSGGELSRAMLARALVGDPDMLFVDEPISGLDPRHTVETIRRLRGLADQGKFVMISSHDLTLAARYATRIIALNEGCLVADGPTAQTLTSRLIQEVFQVTARIGGIGNAAFVDFV